MLKTKDLVPKVYMEMSRDFQLLGHIYEIVFNYLKTTIDSINTLPISNNSDPRLLELMCSTLGFEIEHEYDQDQLAKLCSIFVQVMRNKGSIKAIELVLAMLCNLSGTKSECYIALEDENPWEVWFYVPTEVSNFILFNDIMKYILPSGVIYRVISSNIIKANIEVITKTDNVITVRINKPDYNESAVLKTDDIDKLKEYKGGTTYNENDSVNASYSIAESIPVMKKDS